MASRRPRRSRRGAEVRIRRRPAPGRRASRRRRRRVWRALAWIAAGLVLATALPLVLLRFVAPPTTAFMLRSRWADPATGLPCDRVDYRWVDGDRIARDLALAVVVAEDQRFLEHHGLDPQAVRRALRERARQGRMRGASTLTQQVAKNLFLWPDTSWLRKGIEAWIALWMDALWPKARILEVYLNVAQFGPCVFGAGAASARYLDRPPAALTPAQAALLATVLPDPHGLRAHDPGPYARERRDAILALMSEHAWLRRRLPGAPGRAAAD